LLSRHQNTGQNHNIKIGNKSIENVAQFKYFGMTVVNQNLIHEEIKRKLNSGKAYCHLVQKLLSSCLLARNTKIRIYKTIILPGVLYGCETWPLKLREEYTHVFENRVLRGIFGQKRGEVIGGWRKLHDEEPPNLYSSPSIIRMMKSRRMRWAGHVARMGRRGVNIGFWWEGQKERHH
jgi:hypothetical protein